MIQEEDRKKVVAIFRDVFIVDLDIIPGNFHNHRNNTSFTDDICAAAQHISRKGPIVEKMHSSLTFVR